MSLTMRHVSRTWVIGGGTGTDDDDETVDGSAMLTA